MKKEEVSVVKTTKYIDNSDLNIKGESLGYDWNTICDWIRENELYGQDGEGYTTISRDGKYFPKEFQHIITSILDEADEYKIKVID